MDWMKVQQDRNYLKLTIIMQFCEILYTNLAIASYPNRSQL